MSICTKEFHSIIEDILYHPEFLKLKDIKHHSSNIYDHLVSVSFMAYKFAKKMNLDYEAAARGGLLHDFFLYDWREHKKNNRFSLKNNHGLLHPKVALDNAKKYFEVSKKEEDIIVKHMWPKCFGVPKYKESYVVTMVDKILAVKEYLSEFGFQNKSNFVFEDMA